MRKLFVVIAIVVMAAQLFMISSLINGPSRADANINCPAVSTLPATLIDSSSATLNGSLNDNGGFDCVGISFMYGTNPLLLDRQTAVVQVTGIGAQSVMVVRLQPCTTYYYQIRADECPNMGGRCVFPILGQLLSFTTSGCLIGITGITHGSSGGGVSGGIQGGPAGTPATRPFLQMSAISVKSATISNPRVGPGQAVDVKANITNSGVGNGVAKITVYVNGVEESAQPTTLASGQSVTLDFSVTRNEPGTYNVIVNNVPAGSFTVELFNSNDMLIYGSIALFAVGFGGVLYMLTRKRKTA